MSSTEKNKCLIKNCEKPKKRNKKGHINNNFCTTHMNKATINSFLNKMYWNMKSRVTGTKKDSIAKRTRHLYLGKPILPKEIFKQWAKNHPDFLSLYKRYVISDFEMRLVPSLNRINPNKGYTLDNIEWMTFGQNAGLSGTVKKMKNKERKVIYELLGVK